MQGEPPDVVSVDAYLAGLRVVEARYELRDRALAGAARPDQRHHLAWGDPEAHRVKDPRGLRVAGGVLGIELVRERHAAELEIASERRGLPGPGQGANPGAAGGPPRRPLDARPPRPHQRPIPHQLACG